MNKIQKLKDWLYQSNVHDAEIYNIEYDCKGRTLKIEVYNPIFNNKICFHFLNIEIVLSIKGKEFGDPNTIISLTVEDDFTYLQRYLPKYSDQADSSIYMLFQLLSGDELHIVSKGVIVEDDTTGEGLIINKY